MNIRKLDFRLHCQYALLLQSYKIVFEIPIFMYCFLSMSGIFCIKWQVELAFFVKPACEQEILTDRWCRLKIIKNARKYFLRHGKVLPLH